MKQQIQLSDHFTYSRLIRFTLPSICMMIFTSIYGMVDGFFISNIVGKTAFASVNLIIPFLQILGVVMYAAFVFLGVFNGYSQGSSPIVGYHYGAQNHKEMRNILKRSLIMLGSVGVVLTALAILLARSIASIFVGYDAELLNMTTRAFTICATPFLVMWFNMYTSCFFTALNNGAVSARISFMRALVLPVICIIVLPMFWGLDGVWFSLVGSEILGVFVSLYFLLGKRKQYHY